MEFKLEQDLGLIMAPHEITFNYDQLKAELTERLHKYQNLVVTEDGITEAKKDRAALRKTSDAINAEKIRIKKLWMGPYTAFEDKCKELIALCDAPAKTIDEQIKAYEGAKKAAKRAELEAYFAENVSAAREYVTFEDVFDPKWLNATVTLDTAKEQMDDTLARFKEDAAALDAIEADPVIIGTLKADYTRTKSIAHVLQLKAQIEQNVKIRAEREAQLKAPAMTKEQFEKECSATYGAAAAQNEAQPEPSFSVPMTFAKCESNELIELRFWLRATREQLTGLRKYLMDSGIEYGKVE